MGGKQMTSKELTEMTESALTVLDNNNLSPEVESQALECIQSLLKSMAAHGYNLAQGGKQ